MNADLVCTGNNSQGFNLTFLNELQANHSVLKLFIGLTTAAFIDS